MTKLNRGQSQQISCKVRSHGPQKFESNQQKHQINKNYWAIDRAIRWQWQCHGFPVRNSEQRTHFTFVSVANSPTVQVTTDQTCAFPIMSSQENQFIFIIYEYNRNAILACPMKSRKEGKILRAHQKLFNELAKWGLQHSLKLLDNEWSDITKDEIY